MTKRAEYYQIAPNGAKALGRVYGYIMQSELPPELVELVYLGASQIDNSGYWLDTHIGDFTKTGGPIGKLAQAEPWEDGGGPSARPSAPGLKR